MTSEITDWFKKFTPSDWILFITFLAIVWSAYETRQLRKLQKLESLLNLLFEQTKEWNVGMKARSNFPLKVLEVVETRKYDPAWPYAKYFHEPFTWRGKIWKKIKGLIWKKDNQ